MMARRGVGRFVNVTISTDRSPQGLRYSVVVPTYQRRAVVASSVLALAGLVGPSFEVLVVVDGSTDGTAEQLRSLRLPWDLRIIEQPNAGAASARNRGASEARGEVILFLDDDMRAAPDLLLRHDEAYAEGADAVLGHIPVDPASPASFLLRGLSAWADERCARLAEGGAKLTFLDLLTGQLSVRRSVFAALGGFDEQFTLGGTFGGEDTDFGRRLFDQGYRVVFAPRATSWQHYTVTPAAYLRQWHQTGAADVLYVRKHPDEVGDVFAARRPRRRSNRWVFRPLARVPVLSRFVGFSARRSVVALAGSRPDDPRVERWFFLVRNLEYWRGVERAGGIPRPRPFRVLCYHAVSDLAGAARIEQYGVPPRQLRQQLRALRWAGFRFVTPAEATGAVMGELGLPRRSVLVTFDDCYQDLLDAGLPVLQAERVPAAAFAVAGGIGGTNSWDVAIGAPALPLLDAAGLRLLEQGGVVVGAHGWSHRPLPSVPVDQLGQETTGAFRALAAVGLRPSPSFAYPHGAYHPASRSAVGAAGATTAFTVTSGLVRPGVVDPLAVPRIEVLRHDGVGLRFLGKVAVAGRLPDLAPARTAGRRLLRRARRRLRG